MFVVEFTHLAESGDHLALAHLDHIDNRFTLGEASPGRDGMHLDPVTAPLVGEEENIIVGRGDKEMFGEIFLFGLDTDHTASAAVLTPVHRDRQPFDIAGMGDGDDHIL